MTDKPRRELRNIDLGPDPLDPHGDGTIRKGDPMYDLFMSGETVMGTMNDNGTWDMTITGDPLPDAASESAPAQQPRTPTDGPYQPKHAAPPVKRWWHRLLGL